MYANLKKKYGQNFLFDKNILNKIKNLIENTNLNILEIGPGSGYLTNYILKSKPKKLTIVEIDKDLIKNLQDQFSKFKNIKIINSDIMKDKEIFKDKFDMVVSNLPYNISSQILIKVALSNKKPNKMILMFQKEFACRLIDKKLNSLNCLVKCFYKINKKFDVSKNSFKPIPKVDSTVLEFNLNEYFLLEDKYIESFIDFKRKIFNKKRKSIGSIIKSNLLDEIDNFDKNVRAEALSLDKFIELYKKTTQQI